MSEDSKRILVVDDEDTLCEVGYYSTRSIVSHRELQEREEKDRIKHQLTNNINHELKTPVASIKGCLDTLNAYPDMDARKRQEFVRRGLAAVERLSNLLADVSLITCLDEGCVSITREEVDVREVVAEVCDQQRPQAAERGIKIVNGITDPFTVNGNRSDLTVMYVYFNTLQETREMLSTLRKFLRAYAKLRDTEFSGRMVALTDHIADTPTVELANTPDL